MEPTDFPQANRVYRVPGGLNDCKPLMVYTDGNQCISAWMPTAKERERIAAGEPIYLRVLLGSQQPPVLLEVGSPFKMDALSERDSATLSALGISAE